MILKYFTNNKLFFSSLNTIFSSVSFSCSNFLPTNLMHKYLHLDLQSIYFSVLMMMTVNRKLFRNQMNLYTQILKFGSNYLAQRLFRVRSIQYHSEYFFLNFWRIRPNTFFHGMNHFVAHDCQL